MSVLDGTETAAEHDWLNPLPPLSVLQPHAERTGETCRRVEEHGTSLATYLKKKKNQVLRVNYVVEETNWRNE